MTIGLLEECAVSGKKVLPKLLEKSTLSSKKGLKKYFVSSSLSDASFLEDEGIKSSSGKYCVPLEARSCTWDGESYHPEDLVTCRLTELEYHFQFIVSKDGENRFKILDSLLSGILRSHDVEEGAELLVSNVSKTLNKSKVKLEYEKLSPDNNKIAISVISKSMLGLKTHYLGIIYSKTDNAIVGRIPKGVRSATGWTEDK